MKYDEIGLNRHRDIDQRQESKSSSESYGSARRTVHRLDETRTEKTWGWWREKWLIGWAWLDRWAFWSLQVSNCFHLAMWHLMWPSAPFTRSSWSAWSAMLFVLGQDADNIGAFWLLSCLHRHWSHIMIHNVHDFVLTPELLILPISAISRSVSWELLVSVQFLPNDLIRADNINIGSMSRYLLWYFAGHQAQLRLFSEWCSINDHELLWNCPFNFMNRCLINFP
jgi:hypothetical protein